MSEKKELNIEELDKVSGGVAEGYMLIIGLLYYRESETSTTIVREINLTVPEDENPANYGNYAEQKCNEMGYLYDHFEFEGVMPSK